MKKTLNDFLTDAKSIHDDKYDYSLIVSYTDANTKVKIICPTHGIFEQNRKTHINLKCGCPICKQDLHRRRSKEVIERSSKEFEFKSRKIHGNRYSYDKVDYKRTNIKVVIGCPIHGEFEQRPNDHLTGYGCPKCGNERTSSFHTLNTKTFVEKAINKHGDKFDYSLVNYTGTFNYVTIICKKHGIFKQTPRQHLRGKTGGCLLCAGLFKDTNEFIIKAREIHNIVYDYSNVEYVNAKTKIPIVCKKHGIFEQTPSIHLSGSGCPECSLTQYSKKAIRWLNYESKRNNVVIEHFENCGEYKIPNSRYRVDGFCRETNTVYEFQGDVFHGNPHRFKSGDRCHPYNKNITAGQLLKRTQKKIDLLRDKGYNVITIWESEWDMIENEQIQYA